MIPVYDVLNAALLALLAGCIFSDISRRIIPNILCLAVAVLGVIWVIYDNPQRLLYSLIGGVLFLYGGLALHKKGILGGGDIKLAAALVVWLSPIEIGRFVLTTMIAGGLVGVFYLAMGFVRRLRDKSAPAASSVPYALALVGGFLFLRPDHVLDFF